MSFKNNRISAVLGVLLSVFSLAACESDTSDAFTTPGTPSSGGGGSSPPPPPATNDAPIANAGNDQSVSISRTTPYLLNGSSSYDPNGDTITYDWAIDGQPAGAGITLADADTARPSFESLVPGEYTFSLTVADDSGESATDTIVLTLVDDPPVASAGPNRVITITPDTYELDGSASRDLNGDAITLAWSIDAQPPGANIALTGDDSPTPTFESMVPGEYQFTVSVEDEAGNTGTDTAIITLSNNPPSIVAAFDQNPLIGDNVQIDTTGSSDPNGHDFTFSWELTNTPVNSGMQVSYAGESPILRFDAPGFYTLEATVSDGYNDTVVSWNSIYVTDFTTTPLTNNFTDAEYDAANERIVTILDDQAFVIDPADGSETAIDLPHIGTAVSVAPDGATAAVAHDGFVSHIDLDMASVLNTWAVSDNLSDVVIDGNGYAYAFPATSDRVEVINLATGVTQDSTGTSTSDGTLAKLHPARDVLYAADNGVSPSGVETYTIGGGAASLDDFSPHIDFPFCGDLWLDHAGDTMLTRCRVIVRTTDDPNTDMTYVRTLNDLNDPIRHASASPVDDAWYVIEAGDLEDDGNIYLQSYELDTGYPMDTIDMPFQDDTQTNRWVARYVFADDDSQTLYVLAVDNEQLLTGFALLERVAPPFGMQDLAPTAVAPRYVTQHLPGMVTIDGSASTDPEAQPLSYEWTLVSQPAGSSLDPDGSNATVSFTPTVAGTYEFTLVVNDGTRNSTAVESTVNVFDAGQDLVHRVQGDVDDAEYSKSLNALVYLSSRDDDLHIMNVADFSEIAIELPLVAYRVGISPDGLFAAVSHAGAASLIDLTLGTVVDTQDYAADWGDIVVDSNYRAHAVPVRDQTVDFVSYDFATDTASGIGFTSDSLQIRMHPIFNWVYGADTGISPDDFEKWDVSAYPGTYVSDSPYHGDFDIDSNIWISEPGDRLVVTGGNVFQSSADAMLDMTHVGAFADEVVATWADHSAERSEWVIASSFGSAAVIRHQFVYYDDTSLAQRTAVDVERIPLGNDSSISATPTWVFFNDDGTVVIAVIEAFGQVPNDKFAVQITTP